MFLTENNNYCIHSYEIKYKYKDNLNFNIKNSNQNRYFYILKYNLDRNFDLQIINNIDKLIINDPYNYSRIIIITINENNDLFYLGNNNYKFEINNFNGDIIRYCEIPLSFIEYNLKNKFFNIPDEYPDILYYINNKIRTGCDIFFITYKDSCNTCRRYMKAIESTGLKTIGLKSVKHPFNYPDEMKVAKTLKWNYGCLILEQFPTIINIYKNTNMIKGIIASVKYIHMHGHTYFLLDNQHIDFKNMKKKLIITVGGSVYRFQKKKCNEFFNKYIDFSISQCGDLYDFGLKNNKYIHYPLDTKYIKPDLSFKDEDKIIVGHFPSTSVIKGSKTITRSIHNLYKKYSYKFNYIGIPDQLEDLNKISSHRVSFDKQLERYKKCDIYIETLNRSFKLNNPAYPHINQEEPFGEWGNTCLEACYSGCIVISNCIHLEKYKKSYGIYPGFIVANTQKELEEKLEELILKPRDELLEIKKKCIKWVEEYHSIEKIGEKMYKEIYCNL